MTRLAAALRGMLALALTASLGGCTDERVVARVGSREILRDDLPEQRRLTGAAGLSDLDTLEQLIAREQLAVKADALGLSRKPEIQARLRAAQREVLAQAALAATLDGVTETQALQRYQADTDAFGVRSVRVAQIVSLVPPGAGPTDVEAARSRATTAWASLLGGADFAELARTSSEDLGTSAKGGELGTIREGEIAKPLFEAIVELKEGAYTKPLQGPSGFHIFKALSAPTREVPDFSALKGKIVAQLRGEAERALREQLAKEVPVKRFPEHLGAGR